DPGRTVGMARLEDADALKRRGGGGCGRGNAGHDLGPSFAGTRVGQSVEAESADALSAAAPLAFGDVDVVGAHVVGGLQPFAPGGHVQLQQGAGADGAGHVEVEADRLVDVALAAGVLAHGRELVEPVGALFVVRPGVQRQSGRGHRAAVVLLLFVVERGVDRVDGGGGTGDLGGG